MVPMTSARYARHLLLPEVGVAGQARLGAARVVVIGAGGLGSPVLLYLAAAGVGRIDVVDDDVVDLSNLQRQVLHSTADLGRAKVDSARDRALGLNPEVEVVTHRVHLDASTVEELVRGADVVVDGSDNFATRYLVNDACVLAGIPLVWGAILRFAGQVSVWWPGSGPCYRCVFPQPPAPGQVPSCAEGGVLGPVAAVVGSVQATETLKVLLGIGEPLVGRMLVHDALRQSWQELVVRRDPGCAVCGERPTITAPVEETPTCAVPEPTATVTAIGLSVLLSTPGRVRVVDVRGEDERAIVAVPGSESVPLETLRSGAALADLAATPPDVPLVLVCRSGVRSAQAARLLAEGTGRASRSLEGGVLAWVRDVDPSLPTY